MISTWNLLMSNQSKLEFFEHDIPCRIWCAHHVLQCTSTSKHRDSSFDGLRLNFPHKWSRKICTYWKHVHHNKVLGLCWDFAGTSKINAFLRSCCWHVALRSNQILHAIAGVFYKYDNPSKFNSKFYHSWIALHKAVHVHRPEIASHMCSRSTFHAMGVSIVCWVKIIVCLIGQPTRGGRPCPIHPNNLLNYFVVPFQSLSSIYSTLPCLSFPRTVLFSTH